VLAELEMLLPLSEPAATRAPRRASRIGIRESGVAIQEFVD
jgi:hypothetical protein